MDKLNIMKKIIIALAISFSSQIVAQQVPKSILNILPDYVEQEIEIFQLLESDTSVYTYQINALYSIDNLMFVEHRINQFTNALVYEIYGAPFKVRLVMPNKNDEIQDSFIHIYRK